MAQTKKAKYLEKHVVFGGKKMTMFSLDGLTWSTRKAELQAIKDRHEAEKITFDQIRGVQTDDKAESEGETPERKAEERDEVEIDDDIELGVADDIDEEDVEESAPVKSASAKTKAKPVKVKSTIQAKAKTSKIVAPKARAVSKAPAKKPAKKTKKKAA